MIMNETGILDCFLPSCVEVWPNINYRGFGVQLQEGLRFKCTTETFKALTSQTHTQKIEMRLQVSESNSHAVSNLNPRIISVQKFQDQDKCKKAKHVKI